MYVYVSAMHARERRNVSDIASLALLVDIYGRDVEVFNRDSSCVAAGTGSRRQQQGKPCCENEIAHETDRKSEPACWRAATGSLMNSYNMEAYRSTVLTSLASQTLSVRVWLARLEVLTSLFW